MKRGMTGRYETTSVAGEQVRAFVPRPLPPDPPLELPPSRQQLLERATLSLGRLDSITLLLPDPDLFLYAYVRREAVLSSQIEGTQSSLADLLLFELEEAPGGERAASNAVDTAKRLLALFQEDERKIKALGRMAATSRRVFHTLCRRPVVTLNQVRTQARISLPSAAKGMEALVRLGLVRELTGQRRNRVFAYDSYLAILQEGTEPL